MQVELLALDGVHDRLASHSRHEDVQRVLAGRAAGVWANKTQSKAERRRTPGRAGAGPQVAHLFYRRLVLPASLPIPSPPPPVWPPEYMLDARGLRKNTQERLSR